MYIYIDMALFVSRENQELLWNVMSNNAFVQQYFTNSDTEQKTNWFRRIVKQVYEKYENHHITVAELHNINKETINYMINNIREQHQYNKPVHIKPNTEYLQSGKIYTPQDVPNTRQSEYSQQFDQRQQEYQSMLEKKSPAEIDFRENVEHDQAIQNMDEVLQQHITERNKELEQYYKNTPIIQPSDIPPSLKIDNSSNIQVEVESINTHTKKHVSWENEPTKNENKYIDTIQFDASMNIVNDNFKQMIVFHTEFSDKYSILEQSLQLATMNIANLKEDNELIKLNLVGANTKIDNIQTELTEANKKYKEIENIVKNIQQNMIPVKMIENSSQNIEQTK